MSQVFLGFDVWEFYGNSIHLFGQSLFNKPGILYGKSSIPSCARLGLDMNSRSVQRDLAPLAPDPSPSVRSLFGTGPLSDLVNGPLTPETVIGLFGNNWGTIRIGTQMF